MANNDEGHSINDDLRMMGLLGDDEEDLGADREDLFGRSAASPINLAADDGDGNGASDAAAAGAGADPRNRDHRCKEEAPVHL